MKDVPNPAQGGDMLSSHTPLAGALPIGAEADPMDACALLPEQSRRDRSDAASSRLRAQPADVTVDQLCDRPVAQSARTSVDKALSILFAMPPGGDPIGVSELARKLDLPKSTVHRLLSILRAQGAVCQSADSYRLGERILQISPPRFDRRLADVRMHLLPHLRQLSNQTGRQALLAGMSEGRPVDLELVTSRHDYRGSADPPLTSQLVPVGSVLLALWSRALPPGAGAGQAAAAATAGVQVVSCQLPPELTRRAGQIKFGWLDRAAATLVAAAPVRDATGTTIAGLAIAFPAVSASGRSMISALHAASSEASAQQRRCLVRAVSSVSLGPTR